MFGMDFFKSILVGVLVVAPLGPVGLLFIRRSLVKDLAGLIAIGTGSGLADGVYAWIAAHGQQFQDIFKSLRWVNFIGGSFLVFFAGYEFYEKKVYLIPKDGTLGTKILGKNSLEPKNLEEKTTQQTKFWPLLGLGFFLTIINLLTPAGMITLAAVFKISLACWVDQLMFILGIGMGVSLWWIGLGWGTYGLSDAFSDRMLQYIHKGICMLLFAAGLFMISQGF